MGRDEIELLVALVITAAFARLFYRFAMNRTGRKQKFIEKARAAGYYTEGECVDTLFHAGSGEANDEPPAKEDTVRARYRYTVNGVTYHKSMTFQTPGMDTVDYPVHVTVYYDPKNPEKAVCPEEAAKAIRRRNGCLTCIGITFLFLFVCFHLLRLIGILLGFGD